MIAMEYVPKEVVFARHEVILKQEIIIRHDIIYHLKPLLGPRKCYGNVILQQAYGFGQVHFVLGLSSVTTSL